ncbi:hypothetical protein NHX12_032989 [Muraenolepis orangiensis]|uniref:Fibrinogen C-terminal domain-containing protein n=1 Tax=Muraenolepis orangiensis TaxID=630683 RepID=A0A9Q0E493_9TELE|nr:hypothetical protein NHX12_032989 [Muraenolepis orangiensis]
MKTAMLLLVLVAVLLHAGSSLPMERKGRGSQIGSGPYASWDDVNVVAHGLLQLGQGLKEHVDKSKAQMREVNTRLKTLNDSLVELASTGHRGQGQEEVLEDKARPQVERGGGGEAAAELRAQMEEVRVERQSLRARLERVEEKVNGRLREPWVEGNSSDDGDTAAIQRTLEAQNRRIDDLLEKIRQQQDKLEKQGLHLQALQTKVGKRRAKVHRRSHEDTALRGDNNPQTASLPRDCHEVFMNGQRDSGVYTIQPATSDPFNVPCEINSDGGWTVIQRRHDGSQNFNQLWERYQNGFGNLNSEFWLGLDHIHSLSNQGMYTLQLQLTDWTGEEKLVNYRFRLDGPESDYALHLESISPTGVPEGGMATGASGMPFSTSDRDNDHSSNCAKTLSGGWWFSSCGAWNLNGRYPKRHLTRQRSPRQQMSWATASGNRNALKSVVMKIAPVRD